MESARGESETTPAVVDPSPTRLTSSAQQRSADDARAAAAGLFAVDRTRVTRALPWLILLPLSTYYLYRAVHFRFLTPGQLGPDLLHKQLWYVLHLAGALAVFVGGPLQFSTRLRQRRPRAHRRIGQAYIVGTVVAACTAIYLGATIELEGSRLPIVLLGLLWLYFTLAAWRCAVARQFTAHRLFMIRSFGLALVFVWLRLMDDLQPWLFFYVDDPTMRDATHEWASWVVPLLLMELWLSWRPPAAARNART